MRTPPLLAGAVVGIALGLGGVVAADVVIESADAQGGALGAADLKAANDRSIAAIRLSKFTQNNLGKFVTDANVLVGVNQPPGVITQDRGTGTGGLPAETIATNAITREKIQNEAVDSEKIAPGGVTSGDLANSSVQTDKIEIEAITNDRLAPGSVSTAKIADDAVTQAKVADGAIGPDQLGVPLLANLRGPEAGGSIPSSTNFTALAIQDPGNSASTFETGAFFDAASPTSARVPRSGFYMVNAEVLFAANATGDRGVQLTRNGPGGTTETVSLGAAPPASPSVRNSFFGGGYMFAAGAGDTLQVSASQRSGADLGVRLQGLQIVYLGPLAT